MQGSDVLIHGVVCFSSVQKMGSVWFMLLHVAAPV